jgi:uncharacterized protein (DUF342 family)
MSGERFRLEVVDNRLRLTVYPCTPRVSPEEVFGEWRSRRLPWTNTDTAERVVFEAAGKPEVIIDNLPAHARDAEVKIQIQTDEMVASAKVRAAEAGKPLTESAVRMALEQAGVTYGIIAGSLGELVARQDEEPEIVVARGMAAQDGTNAWFEEKVTTQLDTTPRTTGDEKVDYRDLDNVVNVKEDDVLIVKHPLVQGAPGTAVTGKPIPPVPGKDLAWRVGQNINISVDGLTAFSAIDGQFITLNGRRCVVAVYQVRGNVDFGVGNIKFLGNVVVNGSVLPGFRVEAEGTVVVHGNVDGGLISGGSGVVVDGGLRGGATVSSGADFKARFIENSRVTARGSVEAGEHILHSQVYSGVTVSVRGRKGLIAGGTIRAKSGILMGSCGSPLATVTALEVGLDPNETRQYGEILETKQKNDAALAKARQAIRLLEQMAAVAPLPAERVAMLIKLRGTIANLDEQDLELTQQKNSIEASMEKMRLARIAISGKVYPGTRVSIGMAGKTIREEMQSVAFQVQGADIAILPYV